MPFPLPRLLSVPVLVAMILATTLSHLSAQTGGDKDFPRGSAIDDDFRGTSSDDLDAVPVADSRQASIDKGDYRRNSDSATRKEENPDDTSSDLSSSETSQEAAATAGGTTPRIKATSAENDPFAALGLRTGQFIWYPSVELRGGFSDNVTATSQGPKGSFTIIEPKLTGRSDWSRHQLEITLSGSYKKYWSGTDATDPSFSAAASGRFDLTEETTLDLDLGYDLSREERNDPDIATTVENPPLIHEVTGTAGLTRNLGVLRLRAGATAVRTIYEDTRDANGTTTDNSTRNSTLFEANLRFTLDNGAVLKPFVEGLLLRRIYDSRQDSNGQRRYSRGYEIRGGAAIDLTEILKGDAAIGYRREILEEPDLEDLQGMTLAASLVWTPSKLTTVTLAATTDFNTATTLNSSGSIRRGVTISVAHALRRNVDIDVGAGVSRENYVGTDRMDDGYAANARLTYKLNRMLSVTGGYNYERRVSSQRDAGYAANTFELGLKLQR